MRWSQEGDFLWKFQRWSGAFQVWKVTFALLVGRQPWSYFLWIFGTRIKIIFENK